MHQEHQPCSGDSLMRLCNRIHNHRCARNFCEGVIDGDGPIDLVTPRWWRRHFCDIDDCTNRNCRIARNQLKSLPFSIPVRRFYQSIGGTVGDTSSRISVIAETVAPGAAWNLTQSRPIQKTLCKNRDFFAHFFTCDTK